MFVCVDDGVKKVVMELVYWNFFNNYSYMIQNRGGILVVDFNLLGYFSVLIDFDVLL